MGSDSFQNLGKWKNADFIISNYPIVIYERPGFPVKNDLNAHIIQMKAPLLEISATHIRMLVREGKSIKYLVPPSVETEILNNRFYRNAQTK
jgi:nicotinate-nucleotide adenylyltransferase